MDDEIVIASKRTCFVIVVEGERTSLMSHSEAIEMTAPIEASSSDVTSVVHILRSGMKRVVTVHMSHVVVMTIIHVGIHGCMKTHNAMLSTGQFS